MSSQNSILFNAFFTLVEESNSMYQTIEINAGEKGVLV